MDKEDEIPFLEAAESWHRSLYRPIIQIITEEKMISRFPGRTRSDLYMWTINHWDNLKRDSNGDYPLDDAIKDFSKRFGRGTWTRIKDYLRALFSQRR